MRRFLPVALALVVGVAVGWLVRGGSAGSSGRAPNPTRLYATPITLIRGQDGTSTLTPYHVIVDGRGERLGDGPVAGADDAWTLSCDDGRVLILCHHKQNSQHTR
jgi:hypothetical protein